ncbi:hypothetical protein PM10SUCC1_31870 [Propionigenium maris DSM 9537]|uniref:Prepilin-type N-terminal cleavage/methylation domain-containing protein n=1 Tax=Propionigenium maris DSM 9537 TaxID=1123000 RepID=A0A9W6GNA1_9FUSO|nr:type II secretion system protein [Propionigenium maris]GLI57673.1 hypothetical protein PM10SUCC1_31870 [Propionigenium maris DSM 9537]
MKKKGMTIIESIVTIALLGLVFLLVAPLIRGFGRVDTRVKTQKEIDREFAKINEFIQKKIKSAKDVGNASGSYAGIYSSFDSSTFDFLGSITSEDGSVLYLEIPDSSGTSEDVFFIFEDGKLKYREGVTVNNAGNTSTNETLMENVADATFKYQEGIILYYIDLDIGEYEGKLRSSFKGSASTRIDID